MNKKEVEKSKKKIAIAVNKLEKELFNARNDLERVQVFNKMEDMIESEILKWSELLTENINSENEKDLDFIDFTQKEISKLQSVIDMISAERKDMLPNARIIYEAQKRSHVVVQPTKHVTDVLK